MQAQTSGIGARIARREDDRFLRGQGIFVGDIKRPNMMELAVVRAPVAHARLLRVGKPAGHEHAVFTAADLANVKPIIASSALPGFKPSAQPPLAAEKIRHVGEAIAVCIAATRAQAEDIAAMVELDYEECPAVSDMRAARAKNAPLVHDQWGDNIFLETRVDHNFEAAAKDAPIIIKKHLRTARQCMSPLEGRGVLAEWDSRLSQLILHTSTQMPHIIRTGLAECLGLREDDVRIIAPDVGGGFGYKGILLPEEIIAGYLARHLRHPVRWLEDRREQLTGNANCREHEYELTAYADTDGTLLALDAQATVDAGAYSIYPFSACLEAAQIASILPGPYQMRGFRCVTWSAATNKPGIVPYRGVARAGVCYAMEFLMDAIATATGLTPEDVRLKNLVRPDQMPFDNITKKHFDSGDYPESLRRAITALDLPKYRALQKAATGAEKIGIGLSIFCEQGAHGTSVYSGWGIPMVPGFEQATARLTPDGGLELRVGIHSHGQGLETTLAQVAHEILGIPLERIKIIHGDTALTPYSTGTWGSRCIVMAGGAVATACRELGLRLAPIGAHLLQVPVAKVTVGANKISAGTREIPIPEAAKTWYRRPQDLPENIAPGGLEITAGYKPLRDSGTFSYAAHAVAIAVDTELGTIKILDYAICEDGGTLINPLIVDGQLTGGVAQGIGTALYEGMAFDSNAQPLASTLADYILPGATEVPVLSIQHMQTPSPYSYFGQKGIGEGGAIGPPAAIANAVNDALRPLHAEVTCLPITPEAVLTAIHTARE